MLSNSICRDSTKSDLTGCGKTLDSLRFWGGHGFRRAAKSLKYARVLAPEARFPVPSASFSAAWLKIVVGPVTYYYQKVCKIDQTAQSLCEYLAVILATDEGEGLS